MSLNKSDIDQLVGTLRGFVEKLQAATAIADTGTDIPVIADFPAAQAYGLTTTAAIAAKINRYYTENQDYEQGRPEKAHTMATT